MTFALITTFMALIVAVKMLQKFELNHQMQLVLTADSIILIDTRTQYKKQFFPGLNSRDSQSKGFRYASIKELIILNDSSFRDFLIMAINDFKKNPRIKRRGFHKAIDLFIRITLQISFDHELNVTESEKLKVLQIARNVGTPLSKIS